LQTRRLFLATAIVWTRESGLAGEPFTHEISTGTTFSSNRICFFVWRGHISLVLHHTEKVIHCSQLGAPQAWNAEAISGVGGSRGRSRRCCSPTRRKLPKKAWRRLTSGEGTKGPRLHDWAYLELGDLDAEEYNGTLTGEWTRGLLIRRNDRVAVPAAVRSGAAFPRMALRIVST